MIIRILRWVLPVLLFIAFPAAAMAGMALDLNTELQLIIAGKATKHIPGARYRVAVFAYEDPDATGLGSDLAALIANHVLLDSRVMSLGVLHYKGQLSPSNDDDLSYFNKVDRVIESQEVSLALWGMVRSLGGNLVIDTYLQIPSKVSQEQLLWKFLVPNQMGGGALVAHLRPDRIHVQRHIVPLESRDLLSEAARRISELREKPDLNAPVVARLPQDQIYWVVEHQNDWARFEAPSNKSGWVPVTGHCPDPCRPLLDAAGFSGELLGYMSDKERLPMARKSLTVEVLAIADQIKALDRTIHASTSDDQEVIARMKQWSDSSPMTDIGTGIVRESGVPPGGGAFANILAISRMRVELYRAYEERLKQDRPLARGLDQGKLTSEQVYDLLTVSPQRIANIAFDLAESLLYDPQNVDVLSNLTVLFNLSGDPNRARLARYLATEAQNTSQQK